MGHLISLISTMLGVERAARDRKRFITSPIQSPTLPTHSAACSYRQGSVDQTTVV